MSNQTLTPKAAALEAQLAAPGTGSLLDSLRRDVSRQLADQGAAASRYDLYAVRRNDQAGSEVFGPHPVHVGGYDEEALYGRHRSAAFRFRAAAGRLAQQARRCAQAASETDDGLELAHQAALLWSEIGQLKDFLESNGNIDELVAALRTARYQFLRRDTPLATVGALAEVLEWIAQAVALDLALVDRVVDRLEDAGVDPFLQDALARADA